MSFASYQFLCENTTQYIGMASRSGFLPYSASSSARALERVGLLAELLALPAAHPRQRTGRRMRVELALAGDGALAADIDGLQRIQLARVRNADAHAELLLHARIRDRRLHAAEVDRQPVVFVEVRQDGSTRRPSRSETRAACRARTMPIAGAIGAPSAVTSAVQMPL